MAVCLWHSGLPFFADSEFRVHDEENVRNQLASFEWSRRLFIPIKQNMRCALSHLSKSRQMEGLSMAARLGIGVRLCMNMIWYAKRCVASGLISMPLSNRIMIRTNYCQEVGCKLHNCLSPWKNSGWISVAFQSYFLLNCDRSVFTQKLFLIERLFIKYYPNQKLANFL